MDEDGTEDAAADDGPVPYYVGFQQDITGRKRSQQRVREQRDQLRVLNQIVRHDIGNNLQVVLGRLDLLEDGADEDDIESIRTVRQNIDEAIALTRTAQEMAEATLDGHDDSRRIALASTLRDQVSVAQSSFDHTDITVDGTVPDVSVYADGMLDSVFRNLLENAVRHNDKSTPEVTVSVSEGPDDAIVVRIADNGPGISDSRKTELFGYGEKGSESTGSGMGTYLIDTLVTEYGGDVWVEDGDPEGAVFAVSLPTKAEERPAGTVQ